MTFAYSLRALFCCSIVLASACRFIGNSYGVTNDSVPALSRAVAALPADGSVLDLPKGTYTIGSTWLITKPHLIIRGAGIGETVLVRDPKFEGVLVRMAGLRSKITGLTLDGNRATTVISLDRPGVMADAIEVRNFVHIGIAVPSSGCGVTNCLVTGLAEAATPSIGIWHDAGRDSSDSTIMIDHNTIRNNGINGIYCTGGNITIANNQLIGNYCSVAPSGGQMDIGNAFTTNTVAVITGNTILDGGGPKAGGIETGGGSFTVTNNIIRNHGLGGIGVGHNALRTIISGNTVSNGGHNLNDPNVPQCRCGIYVMYGAENVEISGNRCFDDQPNKTQTWGIILTPPPLKPDPRFLPRAMDHIVIKGNDLRGNLHPEGLLDHSGARTREISGNLPAEANR
jgi:Right handed beta helix region